MSLCRDISGTRARSNTACGRKPCTAIAANFLSLSGRDARQTADPSLRSASDEALWRIFSSPNLRQGRMSGPFDYGGRWVRESWNHFRNCSYGVKVPVCDLDPGVAMLTKTLALLGLHTVMSCDGHLEEPPSIWFMSIYHLRWAEAVLPEFHSSRGLAAPPRSGDEDRGWLSYRWQPFPDAIGRDLAARYDRYGKIQALCAEIMDSGYAAAVRRRKAQLPQYPVLR